MKRRRFGMSGTRLTRLVAMSLTLGLAAWLIPPETLAQGAGPAQAPPSPVAGRILSLKEAINIALENQPSIQARLGDYAAARHRVDQAFSGLLPQIGGSWNAFRDQNVSQSATTAGGTRTVYSWATTTTAKATASQLLFDFGKTFAATDREKANAESSKEDVEIERDSTVLLVKESYFNLLFGKRLVVVNREAVARAELNLRSAKGFFEVGTRPKFDVTRAEAAVANVRQNFRNFFPDVTGNGFYGASRADMNEVWELGITLNWSIFDGGNKIAKYKEAKASLEAAQARVRVQELAIWKEVEQAYLNVIEGEERIQAAKKAVESAQENFRLAQGRFDAGVGTIIELTDAQLELTQAQSREANALTDYRIAVSRLERSLGRR